MFYFLVKSYVEDNITFYSDATLGVLLDGFVRTEISLQFQSSESRIFELLFLLTFGKGSP